MAIPVIFAEPPGEVKPYMLVPVGHYLNRDLQRAAEGSVVTFRTWDRRYRRRIVRMCRLPLKSELFTFMLRSLHGEGASLGTIMERWRRESVIEGFGRDGVNTEECLLLEIGSDLDDAAKAAGSKREFLGDKLTN